MLNYIWLESIWWFLLSTSHKSHRIIICMYTYIRISLWILRRNYKEKITIKEADKLQNTGLEKRQDSAVSTLFFGDSLFLSFTPSPFLLHVNSDSHPPLFQKNYFIVFLNFYYLFKNLLWVIVELNFLGSVI